MTNNRTECGDCGAVIDTSADTANSRAPCPKWGGLKRAFHLTGTDMQLTDYALDQFVAHKLSLLTERGAKEIADPADFLNAFILNTIVGPRSQLDSKTRAYVFNFIRRAGGAVSAYREARAGLIEYVSTPREVISPYFKALLNFEVFIAQSYQAYELLVTASGIDLFVRGDQSDGERLNKLYNDSKHMNRMIVGGQLPPEATAGLWITNQGLESSRASLSFDEIAEMIPVMLDQAKKLSGAG